MHCCCYILKLQAMAGLAIDDADYFWKLNGEGACAEVPTADGRDMASVTIGDMQIYTQSEISEAILIGQKLMYCFDMMFVLGPSEKGNSNCFALSLISQNI
jgi:hypothetical protein